MPIQQQGQQGVTEETAEGRRILQNNAGVTKRRLAKIFDDRITERHIGGTTSGCCSTVRTRP
jgi:hypothetical protein